MDVFTSASRDRQDAGSGESLPIRSFSAPEAVGGFTLIELVVTLAVVFIGLHHGMTWLQPVLVENRIVTRANTLLGMLQMARSEAIRHNRDVVICHSRDGLTCDRLADWTDSWIVFLDANRNRQRDPTESILAFRQAPDNGTRATYRAFGSRHYLTYRPDGRTRTNGTFTLCDPRFAEASRAVIVTKSGRPRISRKGPGGRALRCGK